jgi:hypothetical protein
MQWMSRFGGTSRLSLSEGEGRATGEQRRDANYQAITAPQYRRPTAIAPFLHTQFRDISETQLDIRSASEASDNGISVPSTHEPKHEQSGLL